MSDQGTTWNTRSLPGRAAAAAVLVALAVGLGGCAGAAVGAGATLGVAAYQERGVAGAFMDQKTAFRIRELWFRHDHVLPAKVGIEVYEGRALLTGVVDSEQMRADAVGLAWKAEGVVDVLNEIQVSSEGGIVELARDSWITAQLEYKLTFDEEIMAINYAIETVNGTVYLIGIAQSPQEVDRVIAHARTIEYVLDIVSHVRIKEAP